MINASTASSSRTARVPVKSLIDAPVVKKTRAVKEKIVKVEAKPKVTKTKVAKVKAEFTRSHLDWLEREDDKLLEFSFSSDSLTVYDFSKKFSRDPVQVLFRLLESEIPEMAGIEMEVGSDEACEFFGLTLAGVPIDLALRWGAATIDQDNRPAWSEVQSAMTFPDAREALYFARDHGLWFSGVSQLDDLFVLVKKPSKDICMAVNALVDRVDSLSAKTVLAQLAGELRRESAINWSLMKTSVESGGSSGKRYGWKKKRSSSSSSYSAPKRSWGRKSYSKKRA